MHRKAIWTFILLSFVTSSWAAGVKIVEDYTDFAAAIDALDDNPTIEYTLTVSSPQTVSYDITVPKNITLEFAGQGQLSVDYGAIVTINGPLQSPIKQIFSGNGRVYFHNNNNIDVVRPDWWGTDAAAIQSAIDSLGSTSGTVQLSRRTYDLQDTSLYITTAGIKLAGVSMGDRLGSTDGTTLRYTGPKAAIILSDGGNAATNYVLENFRINGGGGMGKYGIITAWDPVKNAPLPDGSAVTGRMSNLYLINLGITGIHLGNAEVSQFDNVWVKGSLGKGVHIEGSTNTSCTFNNLRIIGSADVGLHIEGAKRYTFVGGAVEDSGAEAVRIETRPSEVTFIQTWFENNLTTNSPETKYQFFVNEPDSTIILQGVDHDVPNAGIEGEMQLIKRKLIGVSAARLTLINNKWNKGDYGVVSSPLGVIGPNTRTWVVGETISPAEFNIPPTAQWNAQGYLNVRAIRKNNIVPADEYVTVVETGETDKTVILPYVGSKGTVRSGKLISVIKKDAGAGKVIVQVPGTAGESINGAPIYTIRGAARGSVSLIWDGVNMWHILSAY